MTVSPDVRGAYFGSLDRAFEGFTFVDDSAAHMIAGCGAGSARYDIESALVVVIVLKYLHGIV